MKRQQNKRESSTEKIMTRNQSRKNQEMEMSRHEEAENDDQAQLIQKEKSSSSDDELEKKEMPPQNARKDLHNIALLMFLYLLQGIPLGLSGSLPYILSARKVSYTDQGTFSFAFWPFSLKLLWYTFS
jgi:hypothetical protein